MNAERRSALENIKDQIEDLRSQLDDIVADEQEYYDSMPESLKGSDRGQDSEGAIADLKNAISDLSGVEDYLWNVFLT